MATRLSAPPHSPAVVTAVLSEGPDFRAVLWTAERAAEAAKVPGGQRQKFIRAYLLAILEHRVAVEKGVILQPKGVE